jgi:small GTP-binding protein
MEEELIPSEMIFKIIIIGDLSSGKTNIISRYISNKFIQDSQPTIGVEMFSKEFKINEDTVIAQIWDTAGQEKYYTLTSSYYKGAKGALIVYDVSQRNTFLKVEKFVNDLKENCDKRVYTILVGNKIDLEENRTVSTEEGKNLANKLKMGFYEVSAKDGTGINNLFQKIVNEVYDKNNREFKSMASIEIMDSKDEKRFSLGGNNSGESKKKKCC